MLSKRLEAISSLVTKEDIIDVGCEGAMLDIHLALNKDINCLAIDINKNSFELAKHNIEKYNLTNKIKLVNTNGLKDIDYHNKLVIISGIGTKEIIKILNNNNPDDLIISSHNDLFLLRKYMSKRYHIIDEKVVLDNKKYYVIIKFKKGKKHITKIECLLGPIIIRSNNIEYIKHIYVKQLKYYQDISNKKVFKKIKQRIRLTKIKLFIK